MRLLWQQLSAQLPGDAEVLGVAAEVEGDRWLRGYLRDAKVKFPVLVDRKNVVGGAYGFKAGPNVLMFDEAGALAYRRLYDASLRKPDCRAEIEDFLVRGRKPAAREVDPSFAPKAGSQEAFAEAVDLYLDGDLKGCRLPWKRSVDLDREHWISQEQIWVLDAPERFHPYIDVPWQSEQLAAEGRPVCACEMSRRVVCTDRPSQGPRSHRQRRPGDDLRRRAGRCSRRRGERRRSGGDEGRGQLRAAGLCRQRDEGRRLVGEVVSLDSQERLDLGGMQHPGQGDRQVAD